jgi:hypothetical protein
MVIFKIKSQIKSPYFNAISKISKSSQNDLKSDFVKSSIKSLNTLLDYTFFDQLQNKFTCQMPFQVQSSLFRDGTFLLRVRLLIVAGNCGSVLDDHPDNIIEDGS